MELLKEKYLCLENKILRINILSIFANLHAVFFDDEDCFLKLIYTIDYEEIFRIALLENVEEEIKLC